MNPFRHHTWTAFRAWSELALGNPKRKQKSINLRPSLALRASPIGQPEIKPLDERVVRHSGKGASRHLRPAPPRQPLPLLPPGDRKPVVRTRETVARRPLVHSIIRRPGG